MLNTFLKHLTQYKNIIFIVLISFFIFLLLRILPVYDVLKNSYAIPDFSMARRFMLFWDYVFISFLEIGLHEQLLTLVLSILTSINILLFIIFVRRQRTILVGKGFFASISGMFLGLFGIGCLSCGVLVMAPVLTFFGLGAYINTVSEHALLVSYFGVILVTASILFLTKKISEPLVCK